MGRILAIDYGEKRTGLAVSDPMKIIANNIGTIKTAEIFDWFKMYQIKEKIDEIVIGYPKRLNNIHSDICVSIDKFIADFSEQFPSIPVILYDERFTSKIAFRVMIDAGLKKKSRQNKALIDSISATLILEEYLNFVKNKQK